MIDQLIIGTTFSYDDFGASVKERRIEAPKKKSIKETVPFSNIAYDFSKINGEIYWEERTLEYVLEIVEITPEELEETKIAINAWLMNVENEKLFDPFILDFHFLATFSNIAYEDELEKTTITVTFTAYPYKIANAPKAFSYALTTSNAVTAKIANNSAHRITPTFISNVPFTVKMGENTYSMGSGTTKDDSFKLEMGINQLEILATSSNGNVKVEFSEEVL